MVYYAPLTAEIVLHTAKAQISATTMVEPDGVPKRTDTVIPTAAQATPITAEQTITHRKLLKTLIADIAGKMISAEMSREPTKRIEREMTTAVTTAIMRLYAFAPPPVACIKVESKVRAKILL